MNDNEIRTRRLLLRAWRIDDAAALYKYASDSRVSELALWPAHTSVEMSRWVIENIFMSNTFSWAITLQETNEPIGCIGFVPEGNEHYAINPSGREVGYWIGRPYWNKGLATEALAGLIAHCREKGCLKYLLITTDMRNLPSGRVAEKCGFSFIENYLYDNIKSCAYRLDL